MTIFRNIGTIVVNKYIIKKILEIEMEYFSRGEIKMKSTGIVRKVDELGRVVIPIELRRTLGISEKDSLEIYVDDDKIVLKKYKPNMTCLITGEVSEDNIVLADGKIVLSRQGAEQLISEVKKSFNIPE